MSKAYLFSKLNESHVVSSFKKWARKSTIHGFSHAGVAKTRKICVYWSLGTLFCLSMLCYYLSIRLDYFIKSGVVTSLNYQAQPSLQLPDISICLNNAYDITEIYYLKVIIMDILSRKFYQIKNQPNIKMAILNFIANRKLLFQMNTNNAWSVARNNQKLNSWKFIDRLSLIDHVGPSLYQVIKSDALMPFCPDLFLEVKKWRQENCQIVEDHSTIRYVKFCHYTDSSNSTFIELPHISNWTSYCWVG